MLAASHISSIIYSSHFQVQLVGRCGKWIADWPGQLLITAGQILWTTECEKGLTEVEKGNKLGLKTTKKKWVIMLNKYAEMIRAGMKGQVPS